MSNQQGSPMSEVKRQRSFATDLEISFGMLTAVVDVAPIKRQNYSKIGEVHYACPSPEHDTPERMVQRYICLGKDGHEYAEHELKRMKIADDDKSAVFLSDEELTAARIGTLEKNALELHVHPADEVEAVTVATDTSYRVRLGKKASERQRELYGILSALAADPELALVGSLRLRDSRRVYRLVLHRGQLTLIGLLLPSELEPVDEIEIPEIDAKLLAMAETLVETMVEPFADGKPYDWDVETAFAELLATKSDEPAPEVATKSSDEDILAALEAMLNQRITTPSRKARPRKAAKKSAQSRATASKEN